MTCALIFRIDRPILLQYHSLLPSVDTAMANFADSGAISDLANYWLGLRRLAMMILAQIENNALRNNGDQNDQHFPFSSNS